MEQLRLFNRDPLCCEYAIDIDLHTVTDTIRTVGESGHEFRKCSLRGKPVYVQCHRSLCGEPPRCSYEPSDNTEEARLRRLEWMRAHE